MAKTFTTIYRTGGTDNFQWKRAETKRTREDAGILAQQLRRAGHLAMVFETATLNSVGMPDTYNYLESQTIKNSLRDAIGGC